MTDLDLSEAEIAEMFGGKAQPVETDPDEMAVADVLARIRSLLHKAAEEGDVRVNQLAGRLDVSPSVVSRMLRSEGDMKVSTAVLWARALGKVWKLALDDLHQGVRCESTDLKSGAITRVMSEHPAAVSNPDYKTARLIFGAYPAPSMTITRLAS